MTSRWLRFMAMVGASFVLAACGGGSGRGGTDLSVSGTGPDGALRGSETAVFVMTVANRGDNDAEDVQLTNTLGNGMTLTEVSCEAEDGAVCPEPVGPAMSVPELKAGGRLVIRVSATVPLGIDGTLTNTLSANFSEETDRGDNSSTVTAQAASSDTHVEARLSEPPYVIGAQHRFSVVVGNAGPADAVDVVLRYEFLTANVFPDGVLACVPAGGAAAPETQADGSLKSASVPPGATLSCELPILVDDRFAFGARFDVSALGEAKLDDNTATVRSNQPTASSP